MISKLLITILVALISMACGTIESAAEANIYQYRTSGLDSEELQIAHAAADTWCQETGKCITFTEDGSNELNVKQDTCGNTTFGTTCKYDNYYVIDIKPLRDRADWKVILYHAMLHEFGHSLGCYRHLSDKSVMNPDWNNSSDYPTVSDITCVMEG